MVSRQQQLDPPVPASEIASAFELLYPEQFRAVLTVLKGSKRLALIPTVEPEREVEDAEEVEREG